MDPTKISASELTEVVKAFAQFGILGWVTVLLGRRFLQTSDDDRRYIREHGERMSIALERISLTNDALVKSNGDLVKANAVLVESHKELLHFADRLVARIEVLEKRS